MVKLEDLVDAYVARYASRESAADESTFPVFQEVDELVRERPGTALAFLVACSARDMSDFCRSNLAAGPLEELLVQHGPAVIDSIAAEAGANAAFKQLLGGVWLDSTDSAVRRRIEQLQGDLW